MLNPEQLLVGEAELRKLMGEVRDFALRYVADGVTEAFPPHLFVLTRDTEKGEDGITVYMIAMDFNEDHEKAAILERIGKKVYAAKLLPVAAVLASEAWAARQDGEGPHPEPRHNPNRQEVIVAFGQTLCSKHAAIGRSLITREAGKIRLGPWEDHESDGTRVILLAHFFRGFFARVAKKYGVDMG